MLLFCVMLRFVFITTLFIYVQCELEGEDIVRHCYNDDGLENWLKSPPLKSNAKHLPTKLEPLNFNRFFVDTSGHSWGLGLVKKKELAMQHLPTKQC